MTAIAITAALLACCLVLAWRESKQRVRPVYRLVVRNAGGVWLRGTIEADSYASALEQVALLFGDRAELLCEGEREERSEAD